MADKQEWKGESYEAFRERIFGTPYMVWHDGPGVSGSLRREGEEGEHNRAMLTEGAEGQDYAAIVGWEAFDPVGGVIVLKPLVKTARRPEFVGRLVEYLQKHDKHASKADIAERETLLADVIANSGSFASLDALMTSSKVPSREVVESLLKKVEGKHYLTRYHAANSLLKMVKGKKAGISKHKKIFRGIISRIGEDNKELPNNDEDRARYAKTAKTLRGMVSRRWPMLKLKLAVKKITKK